MILSISESVPSITQGGSFTVVAIVTDSQGLSNLAGGQLKSSGGAVLGAFLATTQGTYSLTVSWNQLNSGTPLTFVRKTSFAMEAIFYNAQGAHTSQSLSIQLTCGSATSTDAACEGECVNLLTAQHCGSCSRGCAVGLCQSAGVCASSPYVNTPGDTCDAKCSGVASGWTCVGAHFYDPSRNISPSTCSATLTQGQVSATDYISCSCQGQAM
jgi:hypothetical protein